MKYLILLLILTGCGTVDLKSIDWEGIGDIIQECQNKPECPEPITCPDPIICPDCPETPIVPEPPVIEPNPTLESPQSFKNGNLWKPVADNGGNLVVLLKASNPDFDKCRVKLKTGQDHYLYQLAGYERTNGNRPTFRSTKKCAAFKKVLVICEIDGQKVKITAKSDNVCQRYE